MRYLQKNKTDLKRSISFMLSVIMVMVLFLPHLPEPLKALAEPVGSTKVYDGKSWDLFCIDSHRVTANGALCRGDVYQRVEIGSRMNLAEQSDVFWGLLSYYKGKEIEPYLSIVNRINTWAATAKDPNTGEPYPQIKPVITDPEEIKEFNHGAGESTLSRYPWLMFIRQEGYRIEDYMRAGGLLAGSGTTVSGKPLPSVIASNNSPENPYVVKMTGSTGDPDDAGSGADAQPGEFAIPFDPSGADADFIQKVPLKFWNEQTQAFDLTTPTGNWTYEKTDTRIVFRNPDKKPPTLRFKFDSTGTEYETRSGKYSSWQDAYEQAIELWVCIECAQKRRPVEKHQRHVKLELEEVPTDGLYGVIGADPGQTPSDTALNFNIYKHEEDWTSTYNVQLKKYDHETGKPLQGAVFNLYERFDDQDQIDKEKDGPVHIYEGGAPYDSYHTDDPVTWDDFRLIKSISTDHNGHAESAVNHGYHYEKTYCDGHPAPSFTEVPSEEIDPETGEVMNQDQVDAARSANMSIVQEWLDITAACEEKASDFDGVHFHWIMDEVDVGAIEDAAGSGEVVDAGPTESASPEEAFEQSGCQQDCRDTYQKFISLKYSYALKEEKARDGYTLHGNHADDLPIEIITTDSSENGANAYFSKEYDTDLKVTENLNAQALSYDEWVAKHTNRSSATESAVSSNVPGTELETENGAKSLVQHIKMYVQEIVSFFSGEEQTATPGDAKATESNADPDRILADTDGEGRIVHVRIASSSDAEEISDEILLETEGEGIDTDIFTHDQDHAIYPVSTRSDIGDRAGDDSSGRFESYYQDAVSGSSYGDKVDIGPNDNYSHCNNADREDNAWRIYDHRTEGEIHINKRDMELQEGESEYYDSYGDTQGDATLEGAVYGLFAAADIVHPDGHTGIVYKKDNLVAVAATDKQGDASFMANTEAPGYTYDYEKGEITETKDGWAASAPSNLYVADSSYDDYTADGQYQRNYYDNQGNNGNCWIGRPLFMGDYYIKELTRSEGYELSISNRGEELTNKGQETGFIETTEGKGSVKIDWNFNINQQEGEGFPKQNEILFTLTSKDTEDGFDIVLYGLPEEVSLYRKDTVLRETDTEVGTGKYEKVYLTDSQGNPIWIVAENDHQYLVYENGVPKTTEVPVNVNVDIYNSIEPKEMDGNKVFEVMKAAESGMPEERVQERLQEEFTGNGTDFNFVKGKVERALRANGKNTPKTTSSGKHEYSNVFVGVYDAGVQKGQPDIYNQTGVGQGNPAAYTVYGSPVMEVQIPKFRGGKAITIAEAITSLADYYNTHAYYSYGGLDSVREDGDNYVFTVYASVNGVPSDFIVIGSDEVDDSIIFHRTSYVPEVKSESPRYVYVTYSNNPAYDAFGIYDNYSSRLVNGRYSGSATLITDGITSNGKEIVSKTLTTNVYYKKGEVVYDQAGNRIQAFEYREIMEPGKAEVLETKWVPIPTTVKDGVAIAHFDSSYQDAFGNPVSDAGEGHTYDFKAVVEDRMVSLSQDDINIIGAESGYKVGDTMAFSEYLLLMGAHMRVYLDYDSHLIEAEDSYIKNQSLVYPGQEYVWQDGSGIPGNGTRVQAVGVQERPIKQTVKVTKTISKSSYNNTNSYSNVHEDWWTKLFGGFHTDPDAGDVATRMDNFRFKSYLKSNLTRLYRDENGNITWQNRKGTEIDPIEANKQFPVPVNNLFTRVPHQTDPLYKDSNAAAIFNEMLYSYDDTTGFINADQNSGYTAVLEMTEVIADDGESARTIKTYNYNKFFDAIEVANHDKWDDGNQTYTSERPIGNSVNRTEFAIENAKASDMVRQFAISWYLDDEIEKRVKEVPDNLAGTEDADSQVSYSDEMYDEALYNAIVKAENYLKPFFTYDLDEIYAISWDGEEDGGNDKDKTTLSADTAFEGSEEGDGYYYGISAYLPYGTYVLVEQQPKNADLEDFKNKHYQIDTPKEISLPAVYASYDDSQAKPEKLNAYYNYDAAMKQSEMERKFAIRFNEEHHVIKAHSHAGDFEVYKYGEDISRLNNGSTDTPGTSEYYALTQSEFKPYKNYYNEEDDRTIGNVPYYLTEGQSGRTEISKNYRYSSVSEDAGVANDVVFPGAAVTKDNPSGQFFKDHVATMQGVQTAYDGKYASMLVPYTVVAPADAATEEADSALTAGGESSYKGYGYSKFQNRLFTTKLRIEKLDSETHENILHDEAIFSIYAARRDDSADGDGHALFYEEDTTIQGTKEFLEAMCATNIQPVERKKRFLDRLTGKEDGSENLYTGVVSAGTPICEESERVVLGDGFGNQTVAFQAYSTVADLPMKDEETNTRLEYQNQTVGYLETPQPLGAGVYVLCEDKAPRGYTRSKPIALEIYSDKVEYYKEGNKDERVAAALYEYPSDHLTAHGNKPQDITTVAKVNVENTPIKLQVEKVKKPGTVTFKIGKRIEGSLTEIGGNPNLEYAYANGQYLGYAYIKGTLERLKNLKDAGEDVEIVYENGQFAGYGYVTRIRDTDDDENQYVAGAKMTLFDAIELIPTGDTEDHAFEGLQINRNHTGNVLEMFVKEGYAGYRMEMIKETDENGEEILTDYIVGVDDEEKPITQKGYIWKSGMVERPDMDILFYNLDSLSVTWTEKVDGKDVLYGWDKNHQKVSISQIESDKQNHKKSDKEPSIYAFKGGQPYLEFVGGDFTKIKYNATSKVLEGDFTELQFVTAIQDWKMGDGTIVYHLDRNGNRDSMVDPITGMAYILEPKLDVNGKHVADRVLVWPVNLAKDEYGNIIARDKITTSRIATVGENQDGYSENITIEPTNQNPDGQQITDAEKPGYSHQESGYITGTWRSDGGEESHRETTKNTNKQGQNMNEEVLVDDNNGMFLKYMNPVYDEHGLILYYQRSDATYDKGTELYDRNGDFVRYKDSDNLEEYNMAAYSLNDHETLHDGVQDEEIQVQERLYHRLGESYILENTWTTSDKTPNDPFSDQEMAGQADLIKRLPAGTYILEELETPAGKGYITSIPIGITVDDSDVIKNVTVTDDTTRIYIEKLDAPVKDKVDVLNMDQKDKEGNYQKEGESESAPTEYSYGQITGAKIVLYPAKYTVDLTKPDGYRLDKTSEDPLVFETTNSNAANIEELTASWITDPDPIYVEGIPEGYYILEELATPAGEGFVKADPVYVHITSDQEIENITMLDDHTKVAIWKYKLENGKKSTLSGAQFALFEAKLDASGNVVMEDGIPQYDSSKVIDRWISDDATDYTESINLKDYPNTSGKNQISGFTTEFESMYADHGINGQGFSWSVERVAVRDNINSNVWVLEDGNRIIAGDGTVTFPVGMSKEDRDGFKAAYADMTGNKLILKWAGTRTAEVEEISKIDASDAGGTAQKHPAVAVLKLTIRGTGKTVLVNAKYNGKEFSYHYKFNYTKLGVNNYANSWLTADGMHRIDYLPTGKKMVLVEEKAPAGFALAKPRVIEVEDIVEVQLHDVLNERDALLISKISAGTGKEFSGNKMALYRADEHGNLTKSEEYLIEEWISGSDGTYSENDRINGLIPDGFQEGDLRPHYIYNLPDGKYFLVEVLADDYYTALDPIEINYVGGQQIQIVEAVNHPAKGKLVITKTDEDDRKLSGVVFELSAYDASGKVVQGFPMQVTDTNGIVTVTDLPIGEMKTDGSIVPYTYKLRELIPPTGYAVNSQIYKFQFENGEGSYAEDPSVQIALYEISVRNEKTKLYIEKKDLTNLNDEGTDGMFVEGAVLALYRVSSISENGDYMYRPEDLFDQWTTSKEEGRHLLEGLVAGQSYVLVEEKAPTGYNLMKPVLLTISENGRYISEISNNMSIVKVHRLETSMDNPDADSVAALTVKGRIVQKTEVAVLDESGKEILRFAGVNGDHVIEKTDALKEGEVYTFAEHTLYSDGSDVITAKMTKRVYFDENGFIYHGRMADTTSLQITDRSGDVIYEFNPMAEKLDQIIDNNLNPENPIVVTKNRNGEAGQPVTADQPIIHTITYYNPAPVAKTVEIEAVLSDSASVLDPYSGTAEGNTVRWTVENVAPYTQGSVSFASAVADRTAVQIPVSVTTKVNGTSYKTVKTTPIQKENQLTVYNELTGSGKTIFHTEESAFTIRLWDSKGDELAGRYAYTGSKNGYLRSGDTITLAGNEFITIDPSDFADCTYEVTRAENGIEITENNTKGVLTDEGNSAWFTRAVQDTSERQTFVKGETYFITETTEYSDNNRVISNKFSFTLNKNASISAVGGYDKETAVSISKTDITTGEELPGNCLEVIDKDGVVVDAWVSGDKPHEIRGLTPGESYILRETFPTDGFSYAKDIIFTVNEDGTVDEIIMEDKPTHIVVSKQDITNSEELPGAHLEIVDQHGNVVEEWISTDKPHEIVGKLIADSTYTLRETIPADGFVIANEITFTVSHDGTIDHVTMKDDTTKVKIYKNEYVKTGTNSDADKGKPVVGSVLQILNEDKTPALYKGQEIIFTTGESFKMFEKVLVAGRTYWLHEVKPAPGYGYADDVKFTVSTDGSVDVVVMEDKKTEVHISKKDITGQDELPGNHMQVVDKNGIVVDSWISGDKPHVIIGKLEADQEYTLIEVSPRPGYAFANEIKFTVSHDGTPDYVEMRDDVTKVEILKVNAGNGQPLPGAEFELIDKSGTVVEKWTSTEETHEIYGKLIAGETYILHEVKAPDGYLLMKDIVITVNHYADVLKVVAENVKKPGEPGGGDSDYTICIRKVDENGNAVSGASFTVADENGIPLSVSQEADGAVFVVTLKHPQVITVSEIAAPEGYEGLEKTYQIRIPESGNAELLNGDDSFYQDAENSYVFCAVNKPVTPPITPEEKPNKGKITARFDSGLYGFGNARLNYNGTVVDLTAKTGDDFPTALLAVIAVISLLGLLGAVLMYFRKKGKGPDDRPPKRGAVNSPGTGPVTKILILSLIAAGLLVSGQSDVYADSKKEISTDDIQYREKIYLSDTSDPQKQDPNFDDFIIINDKFYVLDHITYEVESKKKAEDSTGAARIITSAPFTDAVENHIPEQQISDDNTTYYLKSYEVVETVLDARTEPVSDTITYSNVPIGNSIPVAAKISVKDSVTGETVEVQVPLTDTRYGEEHWMDGFEFPITVSYYDANVFDLNGKEISLSEETPLQGYETDLLQMIGVSPEEYQILDIQWDGNAYSDDGVLCRNLKATGEMKVRDCYATYEGVANLPQVEAKAIQAVYTDRLVEVNSDQESGFVYTMKATAKYVPNTDSLEEKSFFQQLFELITDPVAVAVILVLLLVILILWIISKRQKKKEDKYIYILDSDSTDDERKE